MIGWTRTHTNKTEFVEWIQQKQLIDLIFGMFSQGQSLVKAIEHFRPGKTARARRKRSHADIIKGKLTAALNLLLGTFSFIHFSLVD